MCDFFMKRSVHDIAPLYPCVQYVLHRIPENEDNNTYITDLVFIVLL